MLVALNVLSFGLYLAGSVLQPSATFYLIPARIWELGAGCLLAVLIHRKVFDPHRQASDLLALLGLALIVGSSFLLSGSTSFLGQLVIPVAGAVLVIAYSTNPAGIAYRILANPAVVYIGKLSYSLYLWHWPVIVLGRYAAMRYQIDIHPLAYLPVMFVLSVASYHFIENTTRRATGVMPYIATGFAVCLAASIWLKQAEVSYDLNGFKPSRYGHAYYDFQFRESNTTDHRYQGVDLPRLSAEEAAHYRENMLLSRDYGPSDQSILLFGDSHAMSWAPMVDEAAKEMGIDFHFSVSNGPEGRLFSHFPDRLTDTHQRRLKEIERIRPSIVVFSCRWSRTLDGNPPEILRAQKLIEHFQSMGAHVVLLGSPPIIHEFKLGTMSILASLGVNPAKQPVFTMKPYDRHDDEVAADYLREFDSASEKTSYLHLYDSYLDGDDQVVVMKEGNLYYFDGTHLTAHAALLAKDAFSNHIAGLSRRQ